MTILQFESKLTCLSLKSIYNIVKRCLHNHYFKHFKGTYHRVKAEPHSKKQISKNTGFNFMLSQVVAHWPSKFSQLCFCYIRCHDSDYHLTKGNQTCADQFVLLVAKFCCRLLVYNLHVA